MLGEAVSVKQSQLVGRTGELAAAMRALEGVAGGEAALLEVVGEPGIYDEIIWAVDQGARVINLSAGDDDSSLLRAAYEYARYTFSNRSDDIRGLFTAACDRLGINWRQMNRWNIAISRRADVAAMDRIIGPKY